MYGHVDKGKKTSLLPNSSSRAMHSSGSGINQLSQSSRHTWSYKGSQVRKGSIIFGGNSRSKLISADRSDRSDQPRRRAVRVLNNAGNDATPLPLHTEPGDMKSTAGRFFLDEVFTSLRSDHSSSTSSIIMHTSSSFMSGSRLSSLSYKASLSSEIEDISIPTRASVPCEVTRKKDTVKQHVTDEMLDEMLDIYLTETDAISLLDIPNTLVSEDDNDAEAVKEANIHYVELCKNHLGNDKYVERMMQTFSGALKDRQMQCDNIVMVDEGTSATVWDIYDSFCSQSKASASENVNYPLPTTVTTCQGQESRGEKSSSYNSSISTGSTISSVLEMEILRNRVNDEPDPQRILLSESFKHSLSIMEWNIVANIFQPKLAAYRQLPILEDPDNMVKPENENQSKEDEESSFAPTLQHLWAFSCEITRGCNITCMAWNKKNPVTQDLLAVGHGDLDLRNQKPGFISCWSLKNPMWPERIFHCHNCVTCLDFSASNPSQLAVGMFDGTVAIYNVQCQDNMACIANSSKSFKKHLHPVWQVIWTQQAMRLAGDQRAEVLVSVSADGRITKWFLYGNGLDSIDLMKLRRLQNFEEPGAKKKKKKNNFLSQMTPGLCIDFHPTKYGIYLVGTWDGLIHMCSYSNSQQFLETYKKHSSTVNHIQWSPFSPDVFLSCSSDWSIQLWKQGHFTPVLSFTSVQRAIYSVNWSPNWPTVFAAINGQQLEIWDLNLNIVSPTIVHYSAPGVKMTALLFATGTDCVLVGDSDGQVNVYKLKNLNVRQGKQVVCLEDIIHSAVSQVALELKTC